LTGSLGPPCQRLSSATSASSIVVAGSSEEVVAAAAAEVEPAGSGRSGDGGGSVPYPNSEKTVVAAEPAVFGRTKSFGRSALHSSSENTGVATTDSAASGRSGDGGGLTLHPSSDKAVVATAEPAVCGRSGGGGRSALHPSSERDLAASDPAAFDRSGSFGGSARSLRTRLFYSTWSFGPPSGGRTSQGSRSGRVSNGSGRDSAGDAGGDTGGVAGARGRVASAKESAKEGGRAQTVARGACSFGAIPPAHAASSPRLSTWSFRASGSGPRVAPVRLSTSGTAKSSWASGALPAGAGDDPSSPTSDSDDLFGSTGSRLSGVL